MTYLSEPYPAYKPSGAPWLGDVPTHWDVLPNRAIFSEVNEQNCPSEQMLSVTITSGVILQQALLEDTSKKDGSRLDRAAYKLVQPGDIAYNKMRAWQGAIGVSEYRGIVSPAYVVQRPSRGTNSRYLHYLLRTPAFAKEAERWSYGITSDMWSLRPEHFRMIYVCVPPLAEQTAIVRFLDHADRRIRRYIRAKQELIALLDEQKQAIIHQAVAGQIDVRTGQPYPARRPSGVEWLGDVPAHWEVRRLRNVGEAIIGLTYNPQDIVEEGQGILVLRASNVLEGQVVYGGRVFVGCSIPSRLLTRVGDILLCSRSGSRALIGKNAKIDVEASGVTFGAFMTVFRSDTNDFMYHVFNSKLFEYQSGAFLTSTINQLTLQMLYNIRVPFPSLAEQRKITKHISRTIAGISNGINRARSLIASLNEYRTRLVADVATGKLDVREATAALPEVDHLAAEDDLDETFAAADSEIDNDVEPVEAAD